MQIEQVDRAWDKVCERLKDGIGETRFHMWLRKTTLLAVEETTLLVGVPNLFIQEWVEKHYLSLIEDAVRAELDAQVSVQLKVDPNLYKAFRESTRRCIERMLDINAIPYSLPWYLPAIEETLEVLGEDFWPEGLEPNWPAVSVLMQYAKEQGLIDRVFTPEELFAPNTLTEFRI